jgi:hypothetical protein
MPPPAAPDELLVSYAQQIITSLDEPCWQCGRKGTHSDVARQHDWVAPDDAAPGSNVCGICLGKGYLLTDAGRDLIAWLERWQNRY